MSPSKNKCAHGVATFASSLGGESQAQRREPVLQLTRRQTAPVLPELAREPRDPHAASERASASFPLSNASTKPSTPPRSRPEKLGLGAPKDSSNPPAAARRRCPSRRTRGAPARSRTETRRYYAWAHRHHRCLRLSPRLSRDKQSRATFREPFSPRKSRRTRATPCATKGVSPRRGTRRRRTRARSAPPSRDSPACCSPAPRIGRRRSTLRGAPPARRTPRVGFVRRARRETTVVAPAVSAGADVAVSRRLSRRAHGERRTRAALSRCAASRSPYGHARAPRGRASLRLRLVEQLTRDDGPGPPAARPPRSPPGPSGATVRRRRGSSAGSEQEL